METKQFKQSYFQANVVLDGSTISTVLVRDFLTASYYLGVLKRLHYANLLYYSITTYMLTSEQAKQINSNPDLLGYDYFSAHK